MSDDTKKVKVAYRPQVFDVPDVDAAKAIILTPERGTTTAERWEVETPYLVDAIGRELSLGPDHCVLDFGCGIGRIAKELIDRQGCRVVGIDISERMRALAPEYVDSERFVAWSPEELDGRVAGGFRASHAVTCWVIQHVLRPDAELARIEAALAPGGELFVLNQGHRAVPSNLGWIDDGISVEALLTARFDVVSRGVLPEIVTTPELAAMTYTMRLRKRG
jgi:SAM-dependent methyltransferase